MATLPKPITTPDEESVRALAQEWVKHYNARNTDGLLPLYTENGWILPMFYQIAQGTTAMRQYFTDVFQVTDPHNLTVETTQVTITGDTAFGIGTYQDNLKMPNGERMDVPGKWTAVLRRVASKWKLEVHCWNTDLPLSTFTT